MQNKHICVITPSMDNTFITAYSVKNKQYDEYVRLVITKDFRMLVWQKVTWMTLECLLNDLSRMSELHRMRHRRWKREQWRLRTIGTRNRRTSDNDENIETHEP
uniref:Uncharacterized protein n=1 Tax=Timema bartmani TaxID=61472 RepID=A0A7R9I3A0_9NEOP|nr:unnamed protein product [Timema bartmani]